jgi:hypothetical protein
MTLIHCVPFQMTIILLSACRKLMTLSIDILHHLLNQLHYHKIKNADLGWLGLGERKRAFAS